MTMTADTTVRLATAALQAAALLKVMVRSLDLAVTWVLLDCTRATPASLSKNTVLGCSLAV